MPNNPAKRTRGKRSEPDCDDNLADDDDLENLNFRAAHWPRRRRSKKNPNDLDIFKAQLLRRVPIGPDGKKLKVTRRSILESLLSRNNNNATPQGLLALIDLLEEMNPLPNPTLETILNIEMLEFRWDLDD
ncbi:MAG: hypothetical protein ABMA14_00545 [Hyphomonadaceae bacterium]